MLHLLPQVYSLEYFLKTELHAESIIPKGMLDSCVCIVEKSKMESLELEGETEGRPWRLFLDCPRFVREETEAKGG